MSDAVLRALLDELERSFVEFSGLVREIPSDLYDIPVPGDEGSVRRIFGHVVVAGYGHVEYVAKAAGGIVPSRRFLEPAGLDDPEAFAAAMLDVPRFAREALEGVEDAKLEARFVTKWGQEYDGEQMMEHAACHPPRHARQILRFLDGKMESAGG